ncbi:MAG: hypothetical protein K2L18_10150, partial [Acetatifactor sp.]|nr:hypothetical protein [Acetatifactor sp.]
GMINALRNLWTHNFKPMDEDRDRLCYFEIYSETRDEPYFLEIEAAPANEAEGAQKPVELENPNGSLLKFSLHPGFLIDHFREKLTITVREFLDMLRAVRESMDSALPSVIFLAGNGSRAPLVTEIFREYLSGFGMEDCKLYHPLATPEAAQEGQLVENRIGSVPNAKTGVAHGLLIALPGSDFVTVSEKRRQFVFKYHLGVSLYNQALRDKVFYRIKNADSFVRFERYAELSAESLETSFAVLADGYMQIWYTDATLTSDYTALRACNARQFLIRVPDFFLSEQPYEEMRGECYCQAVSETALELFVRPIDRQEYYPYGILDLESGHFEAYSYDTTE